MLKTKLLVALTVTLGAASTAAQDAPPTQSLLDTRARIGRALEKHLAAARAGELGAIHVGETALSPDRIRREAVFLCDEGFVKRKMTDFFIEEWKAKLIAAGHQAAELEPEGEAQPGATNPRNIEAYTRRLHERFEKVFMSGAPQQWPEISRDSIAVSGGSRKQFWDNLVPASDGGKLPPFWANLVRGWIIKHLTRTSEVRYPSDGLPDDVVLQVGARTWPTSEAFAVVADAVQPDDLARALTAVVVREVLRQKLVARGHWSSDAEFRRAFEQHRKEFDSTPFTVCVIATAFKGFPSLEAYRHQWRLKRSFAAMIADEIDEAATTGYADRLLETGVVTVEWIPFLARDPETGRWVPDGFATAKRGAVAAFRELENGRPFSVARTNLGQFFAKDGTFGDLENASRHDLRRELREGEFTDLLLGFSLADHLFFDAELNKVVGPLPGPDGYYLGIVHARGGVSKDLHGGPLGKQKLRDDYVHHRFCGWANEVLLGAVIR